MNTCLRLVNLRQSYHHSEYSFRSLGCTLIEMLTGNPPNHEIEHQQAMFKVGSYDFEVPLVEPISNQMRSMIECCLKIEDGDRPRACELLASLQGAYQT